MALSPARKLAFKVVRRVRVHDSFAPEAMQSALASNKISPRDKAFATRLAYGTIATRGTLDELVATELSKPEATPEDLKDALAIAAYELFFEGTESYVVVNQGVELARFATNSKTYAGLSNAVLRRLTEKKDSLFPGGDVDTDVAAAARKNGHPLWLAELFTSQYGTKVANQVMAVNNEPAPLYVTHLPFLDSEKRSLTVLDKAGINYEHAGIEGAYLIADRAAFWALPTDQRASFTAIDLAAQQVVALCSAKPDQHILEVGSGRGTKSLALAAAARRQGGPANIVGVDLHDFKTRVAAKTAQEQGVHELRYLTLDVTKLNAIDRMKAAGIDPQFDTVLVDTPCSGLGTLRRAVDKRWKLTTDDITELAKLGARMLTWSAQLVKPGGTLLFATCTISHEENQAVIETFLGSPEGTDFCLEALKQSELAPAFAEAVAPEGYLTALPKSNGPDGHFAAVLRAPKSRS